MLFQIIAFLSFNKLLMPVENGMLQSIIMYFIVLHLIFMLQSFLELFISPQTANVALFIYCYISYFVAQIVTENVIIKILLFPCLLFGMQNGAVNGDNKYYLYLISAIVLNLLLMILSIQKFKRKDIF